jgi:lambda family phage portal protein
MNPKLHWTDRVAGAISPAWGVKRARGRIALSAMRHFEAASTSRRTAGWYRRNTDANAALGPALSYLRATARDLVRNNPLAESALSTIVDHAVGWGIEAKLTGANPAALAAWKAWSESTDCDSDGRNNFAGLQALTMRTVAESGECLVRRRWRRQGDGFALPMQVQILEPDFIDTSKDQQTYAGNQIIQGVEFDALGRRVAYWLFREHPGSGRLAATGESYRVAAKDVRHVFRVTRAGQVRAATWFANVLLKFKDFDEYDDATLMKQKIAACLAVISSDVDGAGTGLGTTDDTEDPPTDTIGPGMIINAKPGRTFEVINPPSVNDYDAYSTKQLRMIAAGLGVAYEDMTGDYSNMPFSAARMSLIRHWKKVDNWRWKMLIPQFCDPVFGWAMEAAFYADVKPDGIKVRWTPPPPPMIDPVNEGLAFMRNIRAGAQSWSESIRERGMDPDDVADEYAADNARFDKLGIVLDSDPRVMTQAGQAQQSPIADASKDEDKKQASKPPEPAEE